MSIIIRRAKVTNYKENACKQTKLRWLEHIERGSDTHGEIDTQTDRGTSRGTSRGTDMAPAYPPTCLLVRVLGVGTTPGMRFLAPAAAAALWALPLSVLEDCCWCRSSQVEVKTHT